MENTVTPELLVLFFSLVTQDIGKKMLFSGIVCMLCGPSSLVFVLFIGTVIQTYYSFRELYKRAYRNHENEWLPLTDQSHPVSRQMPQIPAHISDVEAGEEVAYSPTTITMTKKQVSYKEDALYFLYDLLQCSMRILEHFIVLTFLALLIYTFGFAKIIRLKGRTTINTPVLIFLMIIIDLLGFMLNGITILFGNCRHPLISMFTLCLLSLLIFNIGNTYYKENLSIAAAPINNTIPFGIELILRFIPLLFFCKPVLSSHVLKHLRYEYIVSKMPVIIIIAGAVSMGLISLFGFWSGSIIRSNLVRKNISLEKDIYTAFILILNKKDKLFEIYNTALSLISNFTFVFWIFMLLIASQLNLGRFHNERLSSSDPGLSNVAYFSIYWALYCGVLALVFWMDHHRRLVPLMLYASIIWISIACSKLFIDAISNFIHAGSKRTKEQGWMGTYHILGLTSATLVIVCILSYLLMNSLRGSIYAVSPTTHL